MHFYTGSGLHYSHRAGLSKSLLYRLVSLVCVTVAVVLAIDHCH